jgi:hypothetical protein
MKYIIKIKDFKLNEKFNKIFMYWLVPLGNEFETSLRKINFPESKIKLFISNPNMGNNLVFISKSDDWGWNPFDNDSEKWYKQRGFKFMGYVDGNEITTDEDDIRIKINARKYNL